jgi:hypothetical protein
MKYAARAKQEETSRCNGNNPAHGVEHHDFLHGFAAGNAWLCRFPSLLAITAAILIYGPSKLGNSLSYATLRSTYRQGE